MFRSSYNIDESMFIAGKNHQGVVVNNSDDQTKSGKLRIRVAALHQGIPDEDLPYMMPAANNTDMAGNAQSTGSINVPPVGSIVWARFDTESVYHGFYHGSVPTPNTSPNQFTGNTGADQDTDPPSGEYPKTDDTDIYKSYPFARALVDQSGHQHIVNNKTDMSSFTHVSGTGWKIDALGNHVRQVGNYKNPNENSDKSNPTGDTTNVQGPVTHNNKGTHTFNITGPCNIIASDDVVVSSQGKVTVTGATEVDINSQAKINLNAKGDINLNSANGNINMNTPNNIMGNGNGTGPWSGTPGSANPKTPPKPAAPAATPKVPNRARPQLPNVAGMTNFGAASATNSSSDSSSIDNIPTV